MPIKKQKQTQNIPLLILSLTFTLLLGALATVWHLDSRISDLQRTVESHTPSNAYNKHVLSPLVEPREKRVYLADIGLYLPMNPTSLDLRYTVTDQTGGGTTDVVVMSQKNMHLSDCNELLRLEIGATKPQPRAGETTKEPFTLADGRQVYSYEPEAKCRQGLQPVKAAEIEQTIRQLQSY